MKSNPHIFKGIVKGKSIELDQDSGFPDGQQVSVLIQPAITTGEGLRRAFGSWADQSESLDEFDEQVRSERKRDRSAPTR